MCKRCEDHGSVGEVAVLLDADGFSGRFSEPGKIVVYRKCGPSFTAEREMEFALDPDEGLAELRSRMDELLQFLGPCRIFVAKSASGAVYFELEKAGCSVWEVSGRPDEFLDSVLKGEEEAESAAAPAVEIPVPVEVSPGNYFISIKEVQGKAPFVSSKQVLQEFICRAGFDALEVVCDHVPPWIEMEAERRGYAMETEPHGKNEVHVRLARGTAAR
ncbi:Fe-only nitrogenase accessory AnfO family protein [Methanoculleus sp.]|jgi:Iron only nitrogenase protein AnfO (AnfO_nitrog).|uniref:Nitrogenase iron-iron accessory protein AnfO n=1 Tax=Methanoculleus marisnigri TaxID=2198 RepID=A0A101J1S9_9EURY|nr:MULTISPECIES: Fe-only nitrogenase accessory AnfO family protein [Methanoculleus]KUK63654.1 MAG: Nitrogenase iron-iron accessory protein AnfO [Methanoculleus marisnigri]KUL05304.1 MAG: Nitrogenase iron-iron accessory protein AnfO [Methanoculleus marisnigri]